MFRNLFFTVVACIWVSASADAVEHPRPTRIQRFVQQHCVDCHDGADAEAGLDLSSLSFDLSASEVFDRWVLVHDRIRDGEMPPLDQMAVPLLDVGQSITWQSDAEHPTEDTFEDEAKRMLHELAVELVTVDQQRSTLHGRAKLRRMNRLEYENTLRAVLDAPSLQVAHLLPEDGVGHLFNKVGDHLDVSHVQMSQYLKTSRHALRLAVNAAAHPSQRRRFYAREEPSMQNYLHYRFGQRAATRSIVPLLGLSTEPNIIRKLQPVTVGDADPATREREAMGVFSGVYSATTKYDFTRINTRIDGRYRLRFKTYTFRAGPNGADGGDDHGLTGGRRVWWRPDRNIALIGQRTEPITLYALSSSGDSRWLTTFDSRPEPTVFECVVSLRRGEGIRPDAARLVRTRPGWSGNPNATPAGVPGFAMHWLEVEGPLSNQWPPASYQALFAELPFEVVDRSSSARQNRTAIDGKKQVQVLPQNPDQDAKRLLTSFYARAVLRCAPTAEQVLDGVGETLTASSMPYVRIYERARELGADFTDAMLSAMSAILCCPEFLYFDAKPGALSERAFKQRLAYFLWNGPVGRHESTSTLAVSNPAAVGQAVERMLNDPRSDQFVDAFVDYWLDLREINANTPDAELYPDYYLDELLTESSVIETRRFFRELIDQDLPVRNLVDSRFAFVNERLARHYGLPTFEGVRLRRVELPQDSPRGGLLTQASVLRVTANGTTTSPVIRGAWITERILGMEIPPPPSGVAAVEPDIRGAKTIREQLQKHRSVDSCHTCHSKFDPAGFALESFDVAGGWRTRYRSVGEGGDPVEGFGKNGHAFQFKLAQPVDCSGSLGNGDRFRGIKDLKRLLVLDQRQLARNLAHRLIVYATGAPISFGDRAEVENILDRAAKYNYGVRSLIRETVQSKLLTHQ